MKQRFLPVLALIVAITFSTACSQSGSVSQTGGDSASSQNAQIDPICGMTVDPVKAAASSKQGGKTYYFCSEHCKEEFVKDPSKYIKTEAE